MSRRLIIIRWILLGSALFLTLVLFGLDRYAALVHRPSETSTKIVLYTTERCPCCKKLRRDLAESAVPTKEYDEEKTLQGQLGFWALRARGIPVSVIGLKMVYGNRVEEIQKALADLGYPYRPAE
jgi:glutaredoxin